MTGVDYLKKKNILILYKRCLYGIEKKRAIEVASTSPTLATSYAIIKRKPI